MSDFLAGALDAAKADLEIKRAGGTSSASGRKLRKIDRADQSTWLSNRGAKQRAKYDGKKAGLELSDYDLARSRKALERKQKLYKQMYNKGTDMVLTGDAAENLLIDFDRKWTEGHRQDESSEDDAQLASDDENDPLIEVQDEFGRARKIRKSDALIHERPPVETVRPESLIYGPHLQKFNPDVQKKDAIWAEEIANREVHYDPTFEIRQRGAGYINLGRGQERQDRMKDLGRKRDTTLKNRQEFGLVEPEAPKPIIISEKSINKAEGSHHVHPTRKHQLPAPDWDEMLKSEAARDAKRSRAGEDFLNSLV